MSAVIGEIQFYILVGEVNRFGRAVHRVHQLGATSHGVERKATRVAEHVEHAAIFGISFKQ